LIDIQIRNASQLSGWRLGLV